MSTGLVRTVARPCPDCGGRERLARAGGRDFEYRTCENDFRFVACADCSLVYLEEIPAPECMARVYPPEYKPFHFHREGRDLILKVRNLLESRKAARFRPLLPPDARILDVGCGDGRYLDLLRRVGPPTWELEGLDFGETAVRRARERGIRATLGAYEETVFPESSLDLLVLNQVFEHFVDPGAMAEKIFRELRPGGIVCIETPSLDGWDARLFPRRYWGGYHFPRHLTLFTEATLRVFLERRGFEVVSVRYLPSPVFWVFSLHHVWEEKIGAGAGFFSDSNPLALAGATLLDAFQRLVRRRTSNMQVLARRPPGGRKECEEERSGSAGKDRGKKGDTL